MCIDRYLHIYIYIYGYVDNSDLVIASPELYVSKKTKLYGVCKKKVVRSSGTLERPGELPWIPWAPGTSQDPSRGLPWDPPGLS